MSISRFATRLVTQKAIIAANTIAADRVKDSSIVSLESAIMNAPQPIVLVYTDDTEFVPTGREIYGGQGTTTIVLILAISGAVKLETGETEFLFPHTDETVEMNLDFLERQIQVALTDPDSPWAQLWNRVVQNVTKWTSRRGGTTKEGARFGARQILIEVETAYDPEIGKDPEGVWEELLTAIAADPDQDFAGLATPLEAMMRGRPDLPEWKRTMAWMAIPRETLTGIGKAPVAFHSGDEEPAAFTKITVYPSGGTPEADGISTGDEGVDP